MYHIQKCQRLFFPLFLFFHLFLEMLISIRSTRQKLRSVMIFILGFEHIYITCFADRFLHSPPFGSSNLVPLQILEGFEHIYISLALQTRFSILHHLDPPILYHSKFLKVRLVFGLPWCCMPSVDLLCFLGCLLSSLFPQGKMDTLLLAGDGNGIHNVPVNSKHVNSPSWSLLTCIVILMVLCFLAKCIWAFHLDLRRVREYRCRLDPAIQDRLPHVVVSGDQSVALARSTEDQCVICRNEFEIGESVTFLPSCRHAPFHTTCAMEYLARSRHCPLCRETIILTPV